MTPESQNNRPRFGCWQAPRQFGTAVSPLKVRMIWEARKTQACRQELARRLRKRRTLPNRREALFCSDLGTTRHQFAIILRLPPRAENIGRLCRVIGEPMPNAEAEKRDHLNQTKTKIVQLRMLSDTKLVILARDKVRCAALGRAQSDPVRAYQWPWRSVSNSRPRPFGHTE